jgi:hypothetical protein
VHPDAFLYPRFEVCDLLVDAIDGVLIPFETFSYLSSGRAEGFVFFKMDHSCAIKVIVPISSLGLCPTECSSGNQLRSTAMVQPDTTVTPVGVDEFSLTSLTEVC